jgi:hypothetical protein
LTAVPALRSSREDCPGRLELLYWKDVGLERELEMPAGTNGGRGRAGRKPQCSDVGERVRYMQDLVGDDGEVFQLSPQKPKRSRAKSADSVSTSSKTKKKDEGRLPVEEAEPTSPWSS